MLTRKNIIIGGILLIFIVILATVMLVPQSQVQNNIGNVTPTAAPAAASQDLNKPQTYKQFLSSGISKICTYAVSLSDGSGTSTGTVYASSGKIRGDFTLPGQNGTVQQHIIVDSYMAYMWNNTSNQGVKFAVQEQSPNQLTNSTVFKCNVWSPNMAVFEIPANVAYLDIGSYPTATPAP